MPIHQEIVAEIGCPSVLHCCGNTTDRLQYFAQAGFDCYTSSHMVDIQDAGQAASGKMTLAGNIDNINVLLKRHSRGRCARLPVCHRRRSSYPHRSARCPLPLP